MKNLFFAFFIAVIALVGVCSCSKKSDSSYSFVKFHNQNSTTEVNNNDDEIDIDSWTMPTSVVTEYKEKTTTTTVRVTAYVAGANETGIKVANQRGGSITKYNGNTTQIKYNNITTTQVVSVSNNNRTNQNIMTTRKNETSKKVEPTIKTTAPKNTITTTTTTTTTKTIPKNSTATTYRIKYVPSLYVETSGEETYTPNEIIAEVFKSSATMWFENEEDLKKVADVLKSLDCYKLQKNGTFNFNDYLAKKGIEEDQLKYLASVLIYESSKTSSVKIDENTFPEYNSYDADTNVSSSNGNLILTANDNIVFYVYVNSYSYSITFSQYITY